MMHAVLLKDAITLVLYDNVSVNAHNVYASITSPPPLPPPPQVSYIKLRQQPARFGFFIGGLGINAFLAARVLYTYLT